MDIEGHLNIELVANAGCVDKVDIRSSRPLGVARVFEGKPPEEVLKTLPLLFSVCGLAQGAAGANAMTQALSLTKDDHKTQQILVAMETAREHLLRVLVDWPTLIGETPDHGPAAASQSILLALREAACGSRDPFSLSANVELRHDEVLAQVDELEQILEQKVFGRSVGDWLTIDNTNDFLAWSSTTHSTAAGFLRRLQQLRWERTGAVSTRFLGDLPAKALNEKLQASDAQQFVGSPTWGAQWFETTPLARQCEHPLVADQMKVFGNGLWTRSVARLAELAGLPETMRMLLEASHVHAEKDAGTLPAGVGVGQVEAARGRLVHRVVLADDRVQCYQILAPTEWNFHPQGLVATALKGLRNDEDDTLEKQAAMFIGAVDPCVRYDLVVQDA